MKRPPCCSFPVRSTWIRQIDGKNARNCFSSLAFSSSTLRYSHQRGSVSFQSRQLYSPHGVEFDHDSTVEIATRDINENITLNMLAESSTIKERVEARNVPAHLRYTLVSYISMDHWATKIWAYCPMMFLLPSPKTGFFS
jgi:hypothetical protein